MHHKLHFFFAQFSFLQERSRGCASFIRTLRRFFNPLIRNLYEYNDPSQNSLILLTERKYIILNQSICVETYDHLNKTMIWPRHTGNTGFNTKHFCVNFHMEIISVHFYWLKKLGSLTIGISSNWPDWHHSVQIRMRLWINVKNIISS